VRPPDRHAHVYIPTPGARVAPGRTNLVRAFGGLLPSMGSIGDCYDNALIESFWSRLQVELLDRRRCKTRLELTTAIFQYLEIFHNRQRRHSALGMLTPVEYEMRNASTAARVQESASDKPGAYQFSHSGRSPTQDSCLLGESDPLG